MNIFDRRLQNSSKNNNINSLKRETAIVREINFESQRPFLSLINKCCNLQVCVYIYTISYVLLWKKNNKFILSGLSVEQCFSQTAFFTAFYSLKLIYRGGMFRVVFGWIVSSHLS